MTLYEKRIKYAQDNDKVIYYDYLAYKKAAGWWTGFVNSDWNRPCEIKRAKYYAAFLRNLPEYYFLGFPIKELLKTCYSNGYCHACAVALSLCFDDFDIITCNLQLYTEHYDEKTDRKNDDFEHTFLVINTDGKRTVIDTTWGMITDFDTYEYIFNINKVRKITSKDLKKTEIYKYIEKRKYIIGPSYESELHDTDEYKKYNSELHEYMDMCKKYSNSKNYHLQDFMNRCLFRTSNSDCLCDWRSSFDYKSIIDFRIEYPNFNMISTDCDEFDFILESPFEDTKKRNARVLESYHKKQIEEKKTTKFGFKKKILSLFERSITN